MHFKRIITVLALVVLGMVAACSRNAKPEAEKPKYMAPRFPSYLRPPKSVDEVLPNARALVRNKSGFQGSGLGAIEKGEWIGIVTTINAEGMIIDAIKKALEERGVKVDILRDWELVGLTRKEAEDLRSKRQTYTSELGYMEEANWIEREFPDPAAVKKWLKERRPDIHDKLFPAARDLDPRMKAIWAKMETDSVGKAIRQYLEKHVQMKGVFWGKGGGTTLRRAMHPLESKFLGVFTADNRWEAMSAIGSYPPDVWQLSEEHTIEPLVYVDKVEVTDPEGTHVTADITEEMGQRWAKGVYQRGHLYMFPNMATGRFGYSLVDYPAFQKEWLPREPMALINGVIAGTVGHGGFYPRWELVFKNGYLSEVRGGGTYGDVLRELMQWPHINDLNFPYHNHPGYFYLYEIAFGTHPKYFRNPVYMQMGSMIPERQRSGVIHWGLGLRLIHDPGEATFSKSWLEFTAKYNLPREHNFHTHTYFSTYRVHLRNTDKWVTLLDKGRDVSLDNPEVRALASRYGDPNTLLTEDWVPEMPGINAPGRYEEFAKNPWPVSWGVIEHVNAGDYRYFYPPLKEQQAIQYDRQAPVSSAKSGGAR